jgi:hypothetical protein
LPPVLRFGFPARRRSSARISQGPNNAAAVLGRRRASWPRVTARKIHAHGGTPPSNMGNPAAFAAAGGLDFALRIVGQS